MEKLQFNITNVLNKKYKEWKIGLDNNKFLFKKYKNDIKIKTYLKELNNSNSDLTECELKKKILSRLKSIYKCELIEKRLLFVIMLFKYYESCDFGKSNHIGNKIKNSVVLHTTSLIHYKKNNCFIDYDYARGDDPRGNHIVIKLNDKYLLNRYGRKVIYYSEEFMENEIYKGNDSIFYPLVLSNTVKEYFFAIDFSENWNYFKKLNHLLNLNSNEEGNIEYELNNFLCDSFNKTNQDLLLAKLANYIEFI